MGDIIALKKNAVKTAAYDTALQLMLRVVSFILNAFIVRWITRDAFAVMTVRLHLLYSAGLLLSREAFRRAALGSKNTQDIQKLINLIWMSAAFAVPLCGMGGFIWTSVMAEPPKEVTQHYHFGVMFMILSVLTEVCAESPYILAELQLWAKTKVLIEGLMQLSSSILLALGVFYWPDKAILIYGLSHFFGSVVYVTLYYSWFVYQMRRGDTSTMLVSSCKDMFPRVSKSIQESIDPKMWSVAWSFFKQGWLKEALTTGELYLMNFFPTIPLGEQGTYQIVTNLGSLAARLVFRPIEEAAYKLFAQALDRGTPMRLQNKKNAEEVTSWFMMVTRHLFLICLIIVAFGWPFSHALLTLYGGSSLGEVGAGMMRAQSIYVTFLALNGITEAFTFATMDAQQLDKHKNILFVFSVAYLMVCVLTSYLLGAMGFIISNCVNMCLRIAYSLRFIVQYYEGSKYSPFACLKLPGDVWLSFVVALACTALSEVFIYPSHFWAHIGIGAVCFVILVFYIRYELQVLIEALLKGADGLIVKLFVSEAKYASNTFAQNTFIELIHRFLFERTKQNKKL